MAAQPPDELLSQDPVTFRGGGVFWFEGETRVGIRGCGFAFEMGGCAKLSR